MRLCRPEESEEESCDELSGDAEKRVSLAVGFDTSGTFCNLVDAGDWYGELAKLVRESSLKNCPGDSWASAELKNSRSPSGIDPPISESKIWGESYPGRDDGNGSLLGSMVKMHNGEKRSKPSGSVR